MSRPLRDRLAELIRRGRLRGAGGEYDAQPDSVKEDYRQSADWLIANASAAGFRIVDERSEAA